tara:strand:- start:376 stop:669 length:294 start_codon:yes stop_codon:yes gene_type:complete
MGNANFKLMPMFFLIFISGCSKSILEQAAVGMAVTMGATIAFLLVCWICIIIHKALSPDGQKIWEKICGIGFLILFIALILMSDGGGDMENLWRGRR